MKYFLILNTDGRTASIYPNGNYEKKTILMEADKKEDLIPYCEMVDKDNNFLHVLRLQSYGQRKDITKAHINAFLGGVIKRWLT